MARAPKKPRKGGRSVTARAEGEAATGAPQTDRTTTFRAPAADHVVKSVRKLESMAKNVQSASGEMGEFVNKLVENHHYDKKALGIVRNLAKMPDERLAITLPHLLKYIDDLKLGERANAQASLIAEEIPDAAADANPAAEAAQGLARSVRPRMQLVPTDEEAASA